MIMPICQSLEKMFTPYDQLCDEKKASGFQTALTTLFTKKLYFFNFSVITREKGPENMKVKQRNENNNVNSNVGVKFELSLCRELQKKWLTLIL